MSTKNILAVDDEEHILELISYNLTNAGYQVITADSGEEALNQLGKKEIDLVLLDWMLPRMDGLEVLKRIRADQRFKWLPVIILTAKSDEISKVVGFEVGADDFLSKPFGVHELLARIKARLRQSEGVESPNVSEEEIINIEDITIDKTRRVVTVRENTIELSLKEFELLYMLAKNKGIVFSRDKLLEKIWGYDYLGETRTVDVHIRNLRRKIELDDTKPTFIKTVRGVGYKIS